MMARVGNRRNRHVDMEKMCRWSRSAKKFDELRRFVNFQDRIAASIEMSKHDV